MQNLSKEKAMQTNLLPEYIRHLMQPAVYATAAELEFIETHISYVILTDTLVYKWKKPVDFGFVNFSTLKRRKFFCEEELRLNRRLCPDIYRRLVWVTEPPNFSFNGEGTHFEYGIEMVRMPEEKMMRVVIREKTLRKNDIDAILKVLIPFYNHAEQNPAIQENGSASSVSKIIHDNIRETAQFVGSKGLPSQLFSKIEQYSLNFLSRENLFKKRITQRRIRDCHGDLHSGNICLDDKTHIFDCIEFNPSLRYIDIAADIAFLAMDLDYYRLAGLSDHLVRGYVHAAADEDALQMLNFYKCYRAYVRGKVALLTTLNPALDPDEVEKLEMKSKSYFKLAAQYASM